jgi:hypothetical protein
LDEEEVSAFVLDLLAGGGERKKIWSELPVRDAVDSNAVRMIEREAEDLVAKLAWQLEEVAAILVAIAEVFGSRVLDAVVLSFVHCHDLSRCWSLLSFGVTKVCRGCGVGVVED